MTNGDVEVPPAQTLADNFAYARFDRLETLRHAQMQVEKAMVDAADGYAQGETAFAEASFPVAGH
jgi:hypothetical protein